MARNELTLPVPPDRVVEIVDFPAETDPPLTDRPRSRASKRLGDRAEVAVEDRRAPLASATGRRLIAQAEAALEVRRALGRRFVTIGCHRVDAKDGREWVVLFYSYVYQWAVEARCSAVGGEWSTRVLRMQPPFTEDEMAVGIELARASIDADTSGLEVGAIPMMREEPEHPLAGRRLADVRFFVADRRLPVYFAIVDLADRKVVESGLVQGHRHG